MGKVLTFDAYPLNWPEGWTRCASIERERSQYKVNFGKARDDVERSLRLFRATELIISSNVPVRVDGLPYANFREPEDPGVAVYWVTRSWRSSTLRKDVFEQRVMACDSWRTVRENLRALGLALEGLRQVERSKASQVLERAFQGFKALPSGDPAKRPWREVLGFDQRLRQPCDVQAVEERYRARARERHPDAGGSQEAMAELNRAREEALEELRG